MRQGALPDPTNEEPITPLGSSDVASYLARLGLDGPAIPSAEWLGQLQVAHLVAVPFENLDIHADRPISLRLDDLHAKIVDRRRGGFCYELNGLFRHLLERLGFDVKLVSSRVWMADGTLSPRFDHAALLVELDGPWLVDVGFGDAFLMPHRLGEEWSEASHRRLRTVAVPGGWRLEIDEGRGWSGMYDVDPTPRRIEEFAARCRWHETSPESAFRRGPVVTRATDTGRATVRGGRFVLTADGERTEHDLAAPRAVEHVRSSFEAPVVEELQRIGALRT
jgi:N-hydroxyarylamine O-acetyltransferase